MEKKKDPAIQETGLKTEISLQNCDLQVLGWQTNWLFGALLLQFSHVACDSSAPHCCRDLGEGDKNLGLWREAPSTEDDCCARQTASAPVSH